MKPKTKPDGSVSVTLNTTERKRFALTADSLTEMAFYAGEGELGSKAKDFAAFLRSFLTETAPPPKTREPEKPVDLPTSVDPVAF